MGFRYNVIFAAISLWSFTYFLTYQAHADIDARLNEAINFYRAGNYTRAVILFFPLALDGSAEAQNRLAWMYLNGQGVAQDGCASTIWREKAARQGHPNAALYLARSYANGIGVKMDQAKAYLWAAYATKMGEPNAQYDMAVAAKYIRPDEKAGIDQFIENWDPSQLPAADFFPVDGGTIFHDKPNQDKMSFYKNLLSEHGITPCR